MKLPANKLRTVIREEIQKVLKERGGDYSSTGFHGGSKKMDWSELGQHPDFGVKGKTVTGVETMGRGRVAMKFRDGTKIEFGTDGNVFYHRS